MSGQTKKRSMDMLHGSIWNKLILYALPVAATGILEQLFNASDVAIVGNFTGEMRTVAVAAVGANSPIVGLLLNLFIGIALGANVVIAHAWARGMRKPFTTRYHTAVIMAVAGGALVAVIGELGVGSLLRMLNVPVTYFLRRCCISAFTCWGCRSFSYTILRRRSSGVSARQGCRWRRWPSPVF